MSSWRFLLRLPWSTGLRLGEVLQLHWTDERLIRIDESDRHPVMIFPPRMQKNRKADVVPLTPEAIELLAGLPRDGYVAAPQPPRRSQRLSSDQTGRRVSAMGAARIVVKPAEDDEHAPSYASAHDLRRCFCDRWSRKVMPPVLQKLARHSSIETTLRYYVGRDAQTIAEAVMVGNLVGTAVPAEPAESP